MSSRRPLVKAPSPVEGLRVANQKRISRVDAFAFGLLPCLSVTAIAAFTWAWVRTGSWFSHPGTLLVLSFIVFFKIANSQARWATLLFMSVPKSSPRFGVALAEHHGALVAVIRSEPLSTSLFDTLMTALDALGARPAVEVLQRACAPWPRGNRGRVPSETVP
jgi:hypothetical protein